jgi:hypothetical protein
VVHGMKQLGAKVEGKQPRLNTPIKFKSSNGTSHEPQVKTKVVQSKQTKKPRHMPHKTTFMLILC